VDKWKFEEYENLSDLEKTWNRLMQDKELNTEVFPEFASYLAQALIK
jgi:hypothetical protein